MKKLYFDCETTGLDNKLHSIHSLAGIIEIDGVIVDKFIFKCKPYTEHYQQSALDLCGVTWDELQTYPIQWETWNEFSLRLNAHIDELNPNDDEKFFFYGYNVKFDEEFLRRWMKLNSTDFSRWFWVPSIDVMTLAAEALRELRHTMENFKLATVADMFEEIISPDNKKFNKSNAHNPLYDLAMTKFIYDASMKTIREMK